MNSWNVTLSVIWLTDSTDLKNVNTSCPFFVWEKKAAICLSLEIGQNSRI